MRDREHAERDDVTEPRRQLCVRILCAAFALVWLWSLWGARYPAEWWLENWLVIALAGGLALLWRSSPLSLASCAAIFLFLCLHEIGAHYTYSEVPYDRWLEALTGTTLSSLLGWERNHFDRLVHFVYGLLIAYPIREWVVRVANARGFWGYFIPLNVIMSTSVLYELIEWTAAEVFGGELGVAYLGSQGDVWDAQKDMALATLGAIIALVITALVHRSLSRDFHREWAESLRVRHKEPLGEVEIARLKNENPS